MPAKWPKPSEVDAFYGDPRGVGGAVVSSKWYAANMTWIAPPFKMRMGDTNITRIPVHQKVAPSLSRVLSRIYQQAKYRQDKIDEWGVSQFGGTFNYRPMRGLTTLSMHAYGIAIDLDPVRNGLHDKTPNFANVPEVLQAFRDEGWTWGGAWKSRPDGMHFEATS